LAATGGRSSLDKPDFLRACLENRPVMNCERGDVDGEEREASILFEICK
jgi:hypothetical protein